MILKPHPFVSLSLSGGHAPLRVMRAGTPALQTLRPLLSKIGHSAEAPHFFAIFREFLWLLAQKNFRQRHHTAALFK
jgi:hypothetical protein